MVAKSPVSAHRGARRSVMHCVIDEDPQRLYATRPGAARLSEAWMMRKSDPCGDTGRSVIALRLKNERHKSLKAQVLSLQSQVKA